MEKEGKLYRSKVGDILILTKINVFWKCISITTGKAVGEESPQQEFAVKGFTPFSVEEQAALRKTLLTSSDLGGTITKITGLDNRFRIFKTGGHNGTKYVIASNLAEVEDLVSSIATLEVKGHPIFPPYFRILKK